MHRIFSSIDLEQCNHKQSVNLERDGLRQSILAQDKLPDYCLQDRLLGLYRNVNVSKQYKITRIINFTIFLVLLTNFNQIAQKK